MARGDGDALQRLSKEQDPVASESQQLLDTLREGFAARGAGWLREELAKQTAVQLRQLAGTAGVQQREAGRNLPKAELLEKVAQHVSQEQDPAATESQQLLDSMREGFAARGAGWLREELTKRTRAQLRQLAGAAGLQQYEAGRNASKAELLEKVAQHVSQEQDPAATDPATTESQQLLDSVREGFAARGAGWLREELAKQTAVQLRQLAGTAGVQQYEAGRNASKAELLEKVAQHVSEEQDTAGRASADDRVTADGLRQLAAALGDGAAPSLRARLRGVPLRNAEPCLQGLAMELGVPFENITRDTLVHRIVMALCPLAAPGAQADIKYHVWRLLRKLRDARAETAEAVAAAARDIVESSNLCRAAAAYCLDVTVEVIARRHCSAAEEARILVTRVVSALQQWPAVEAALASQVAVTWEDAVASLQVVATPGLCVPLQHALLAAVLDARGDHRAGWWRLADCQERADPVDVASRLCFLAELDEEPPAADTDGYEDRKDVLEAVLCMLKHKYRSRKFDEGDTALLRALMRRYGWDRRSEQGGTCRWSQTFKDVRKSEDWSAFAWFLAVELLHPLASIGVRDLHSPIAVAEARGGEDGIDAEHPQLAKRVERHQTSGASARLKALKKAYPPDFAPLAAFALDCLAEGADSQAGVLWRSAAERALVFGIPPARRPSRASSPARRP
ncbi:unnamed protein product [Effrenium voratum]|nr:unnamed protein product [Effrenium voratum]